MKILDHRDTEAQRNTIDKLDLENRTSKINRDKADSSF